MRYLYPYTIIISFFPKCGHWYEHILKSQPVEDTQTLAHRVLRLWPGSLWWIGQKIRAKRKSLFWGCFWSQASLIEDTWTFLCRRIQALFLSVMKQLIFSAQQSDSSPPSFSHDLSITSSLHASVSFSLFLLSYSHLLIFTSFSLPHYLLPSHSCPAHPYLFFHLSPPLQCSHLIIPWRNIFTFLQLGSY